MKKRILITGAAGFIGGKLFKFLKKKGFKVYGVDFNIINKVDDKIFDVNLLNYSDKEKIFNDINPEFIFHFAGFSGPARNEKEPELAYKYNVDLTKVILKNLDNSIPIFFPQTDKIFDGLVFPNENTKITPSNIHAEVKFKCEQLIKQHTDKHFVFRLPVVHSEGGYTPNSKMAGAESYIDQAIDDIKSHKKVNVFNNVKRCFVKVEELIMIHEILLESKNYGTYNLASSMVSYYDRLIGICSKNKIKFEGLLFPIQGDISPLEKNIDGSKFEKVFNFRMS